MHDLKDIRENPEAFDAGLKRRGLAPRSKDIRDLDKKARELTVRLNDLQAKRNAASKAIGAAKAKQDETEAQRLIAEIEATKTEIPALEAKQADLLKQVNDILATIPNLPAADVPDGASEADNREIRKWGEPKRIDGAREHFDIGEPLGMDFETAAAMSGARFVLLKGQLARLERALANFMLDLHTKEYGYVECAPPLMVRDDAAFGTGQLPKFEGDLFAAGSANAWKFRESLEQIRGDLSASIRALTRSKELSEGLQTFLKSIGAELDPAAVENLNDATFAAFKQSLESNRQSVIAELNHFRESVTAVQPLLVDPELVRRHWLIPTAEISLTNIVREKILGEEELPLRFTAWTPCFRSEAGAAGKDTRGMIRMHQFSKVELVSVTMPEQSEEEHERMTACAEEVLKRLELPFRTMLLCAGDMGFSARKTYDIEVWLPGQNRYREISSCSNCGDFQARRMKARYRRKEKGTRFVHTLNGSGLAVGRTLVAVLENYQEKDGSVAVPAALAPYMGGIERIARG